MDIYRFFRAPGTLSRRSAVPSCVDGTTGVRSHGESVQLLPQIPDANLTVLSSSAGLAAVFFLVRAFRGFIGLGAGLRRCLVACSGWGNVGGYFPT